MSLTDTQQARLSTAIQAAWTHTATMFSNVPVSLNITGTTLLPLTALATSVPLAPESEVATVKQQIVSPIAGQVVLLLPAESAILLANLLTTEPPQVSRLTISARELVTEVGSTVLRAFLDATGDLLQMSLTLTPPRFESARLVNSLPEADMVLVVQLRLLLRASEVPAFILTIFDVPALERLLQSLDQPT